MTFIKVAANREFLIERRREFDLHHFKSGASAAIVNLLVINSQVNMSTGTLTRYLSLHVFEFSDVSLFTGLRRYHPRVPDWNLQRGKHNASGAFLTSRIRLRRNRLWAC
jgi:hypothetical protein